MRRLQPMHRVGAAHFARLHHERNQPRSQSTAEKSDSSRDQIRRNAVEMRLIRDDGVHQERISVSTFLHFERGRLSRVSCSLRVPGRGNFVTRIW